MSILHSHTTANTAILLLGSACFFAFYHLLRRPRAAKSMLSRSAYENLAVSIFLEVATTWSEAGTSVLALPRSSVVRLLWLVSLPQYGCSSSRSCVPKQLISYTWLSWTRRDVSVSESGICHLHSDRPRLKGRPCVVYSFASFGSLSISRNLLK